MAVVKVPRVRENNSLLRSVGLRIGQKEARGTRGGLSFGRKCLLLLRRSPFSNKRVQETTRNCLPGRAIT